MTTGFTEWMHFWNVTLVNMRACNDRVCLRINCLNVVPISLNIDRDITNKILHVGMVSVNWVGGVGNPPQMSNGFEWGGIHWWGEGHSFPMHLLFGTIYWYTATCVEFVVCFGTDFDEISNTCQSLSQVCLQLIYQRVLKPGVLSPVISYLSNAISWHGLAMNWIMRFVRTTWTYLRYDEPPHVWRTNTITVTNQPTDGASSSIWLSFFGRFYLHGNKQFLDVWPSHSLEKTSTIIHVPTFLFYL